MYDAEKCRFNGPHERCEWLVWNIHLYISKFVLHVGPEKNKNKPRRRSLKLLILGQLCQLSDTRKAMAVSAGDVLSSVAAEEAAALSTVEVKRPFEPQVSA